MGAVMGDKHPKCFPEVLHHSLQHISGNRGDFFPYSLLKLFEIIASNSRKVAIREEIATK
jgi:hypothetical protein